MRIRVLYFATLRDLAGTKQEELTFPGSLTVAELKQHLTKLHPRLAPAMNSTLFSINREFAQAESGLKDGDEVAAFPPVSGGSLASGPSLLRLTEEPLDLNQLLESLVLPSTGAACVFAGVVRAITEREEQQETLRLEYQAYETMAAAKMQQVADEMRSRWPQLERVAIIQRIGTLEPGTPSVLLACTAAHRDSGVFEAARYGIDRLKEIVPVWKKEIGVQGETWVEGDYRPGSEA